MLLSTAPRLNQGLCRKAPPFLDVFALNDHFERYFLDREGVDIRAAYAFWVVCMPTNSAAGVLEKTVQFVANLRIAHPFSVFAGRQPYLLFESRQSDA
jgi:hypothetical protein